MAFRVQRKIGDAFHTFRASEEPVPGKTWSDSGLYWHAEGPGGPRDPSLPLIPVDLGFSTLDGYMTKEEAEQATGLHAPVCFDKIRDLM